MRNRHFRLGGGRPALVSLLAAMAVCTVPTKAARADIVAYWNFNDTFAANVGGPAYNLTQVNGASIEAVAAKFGPGGADFQRASSQYAYTASTVVASGSDFSFSAWYFLDLANIPNTTDRYFVLEATDGTLIGPQSHPISLGLRDLSGDSQDDVAQIYTSVNNDSDVFFSFDTLPNQTWHNVITTFDAATLTITSYFDGTQVGQATASGALDPGNGLVVGGHRAGTGRNFDGYIDDVAIWNEVIGSSEIARLQTQPVVPVPEPSFASLCLAATGLIIVRLCHTRW